MPYRTKDRADELNKYRQRIDVSKRWREKEGYDDLWERLVNLYKGEHWPNSLTHEDRIVVNVSFATINVIFPSVSVNHPKVTVFARKPEDDDRAIILETALNYWWRHYDVKPEFRRAVKDFLIIGHGWLKTGYRYVEEEQDLEDEELQDAFAVAKTQADEFAVANPDQAGTLPTDADIYEGLPKTKSVPVEDRPFVERVSYEDVYVDPEATSMRDLRWIAHKIVKTVDEVKEDERYDATARRKIEADSSVDRDYLRDNDPEKYGDDIKRVTVWEWYDVKKRTMCVFPEVGDRFLIEPRPMPYTYGHPFVMIRNYDVPDCFYPIGDLEAIEHLQLELNKTRSQMMNHRKRYARKILTRQGAFTAQGRQALESDEDGALVDVTEGVDFGDAFQPVEFAQLPPEVYNQSAIIEGDIDTVSGVSEYARGQAPDVRRTATEAAMIQDATNARSTDKLAIIEEAIGEVARRLTALAQQFMTGEQIVRVIGANGAPLWVPFERDDVEGEYDFEVEGGSTQPRNEAFRRQQALALLQAVAPFGPFLNVPELLKHVLQFGFDIKGADKFVMQMPMMPPGPEGAGGQPGGPPQPGQEQTAAEDQLGLDAIPPELLQQLEGQVGLTAAPLG